MLSLSFLVSLSITCFAIYVANVAKEEMVGIFAAIVAILSFIVGLILAPWFIQAALLIFVAVLWRTPILR
ncbi:hypothetical protein K9N68_08305 [Kovacikia minuta CCNUW1]|uniref:hypothetical protein n=1 Tax=Kovacikia minuta TaxID=2931930 RepID=UPI001CCA1CF9|nr:hypothetical protein [Kovacikia minuta]UBF27887.1 hypothetical protein K9N68_08305 [Kovacikia minuta CCNUW1]